MTYDHIDQFPDSYWDELTLIESRGTIQRMADSRGESIYYCDLCGARVEDYDDGAAHDCELTEIEGF